LRLRGKGAEPRRSDEGGTQERGHLAEGGTEGEEEQMFLALILTSGQTTPINILRGGTLQQGDSRQAQKTGVGRNRMRGVLSRAR